MDGSRFDALSRSLARAGSRRRFLSGLIAGSLSLTGRHRALATDCRAPGNVCREHANCCSGVCGDPDRGRRSCECSAANDCPAPKVCRAVVCLDGACVTSVTPGASCTTTSGAPGVCQGSSCQATTGTTKAPAPTTTSTTSTTTTTTTTTTSTTAVPTTGACRPTDAVCSTNEDCCSTICDGGDCKPCRQNGSPCQEDCECCGGLCNSNLCATGGTPIPCAQGENPCTDDSECFTNICENGQCLFCRPDGSTCSTANECCGDCLNNQCIAD